VAEFSGFDSKSRNVSCIDRSAKPEASMVRLIIGAVVGMVLMWLYQSKRIREEAQRRLATAPEPIRHAATSARAASAGQIERVTHAFETASVPQPVKDALDRATTAARSTAGKLGVTTVTSRTATLSIQELPDGSWVGDATWGGRTLTDGAPDPEVLMRRLATSLAAIPDTDQPERIKLNRVPHGGPPEEREESFTALLG